MADKEPKGRSTNGVESKKSAIYDGAMGLTLILMEIYAFIQGGNFRMQVLLLSGFFIAALLLKWIILNWDRRHELQLSLFTFFLVPMILGITLSGALYIYAYQTAAVSYIAPDFRQFGHVLPSTSNYGTNARINDSSIHVSDRRTYPQHYLRLHISMFCREDDSDCNAGWILYNLGGYDSGALNYIVFEVRGEKGGEQFGIGIKDTRNTEVKVFDVSQYLATRYITPNWQTVRIPLSVFLERNLDLSSLYNISIYVDAKNTDQRDLEFYIADIRLE